MGDDMPRWVQAMYEELGAMSDLEKINATGEWITLITNEVLTELSRQRKLLVAQTLLRPGWDATRLAETLGGRRTAFTRLGELGRRLMREEGDKGSGRLEEEEGPEGGAVSAAQG